MATKKEEKVIKKTSKESAKNATATQKEASLTAKTEKVTAKTTKTTKTAKTADALGAKQKAKASTSATTKPVVEKRAQNATATKKVAPKTLQKQQPAVKNVGNETDSDTEVIIETVSSASQKPTYKKYHISQRNDTNMWQVKAEGADKALKLFKTQQEAIEYAKKVAESQDGSIMIHKKDGSFRKLNY